MEEENAEQKEEKRSRKKDLVTYIFSLLKFLVLEICLFVADVGTDIYSIVSFAREGRDEWAIATAICILLPAIPEFFQFFEKKVRKYRQQPDQFVQLYNLYSYIQLVLWILFFPVLIVLFTIKNNFEESRFKIRKYSYFFISDILQAVKILFQTLLDRKALTGDITDKKQIKAVNIKERHGKK